MVREGLRSTYARWSAGQANAGSGIQIRTRHTRSSKSADSTDSPFETQMDMDGLEESPSQVENCERCLTFFRQCLVIH